MRTDLLLLPVLTAVFIGTARMIFKKDGMKWIDMVAVVLPTAFVLIELARNTVVFTVGGWSSAIGVEVKYDQISFWFILSLAVVWSSVKLRFETGEFTTSALLDYLFAALYAVFISNDLFNLYVTIELVSLISFLLVGHGHKPARIWAALKYMLLSALALNIYLIGLAVVYSSTGALAVGVLVFDKIPEFGLVFILAGLLVKSGTLGLSAWLVDAHSKAETPVSMILSGAVVNAGLFGIIRIFPILPENLKQLVLAVGMISAFGGAVYAAAAPSVKRTLAFSTLSQMGIALSMITILPLASAVFAFSHSVSKALLFSRNGKISAAVGALSIVGIPPLAGYFAKNLLVSSMPVPAFLLTMMTAMYISKVFEKGLGWKLSPFEVILEIAAFSFMIFLPVYNLWYILEISLSAGIGFLAGRKIKIPELGDPFGIEEGIMYQMAFLAVGVLLTIKS